jgi:hypothetical protein
MTWLAKISMGLTLDAFARSRGGFAVAECIGPLSVKPWQQADEIR